jgi:hypothetical protein
MDCAQLVATDNPLSVDPLSSAAFQTYHYYVLRGTAPYIGAEGYQRWPSLPTGHRAFLGSPLCHRY